MLWYFWWHIPYSSIQKYCEIAEFPSPLQLWICASAPSPYTEHWVFKILWEPSYCEP